MTNSLVVIANFDSIDDSFLFRKELVPETTHTSHCVFNRKFDHAAKSLASALVSSASNKAITGKLAMQAKEVLSV